MNIFLFHERAQCRGLAKTTYEALQLIITCLLNVVSLAGFCRGENVSVYYRASGVILNHNFTKEFFTEDCEPCRILADNIKAGVSNDKLLIIFPAAQSKIELNTMNFHSDRLSTVLRVKHCDWERVKVNKFTSNSTFYCVSCLNVSGAYTVSKFPWNFRSNLKLVIFRLETPKPRILQNLTLISCFECCIDYLLNKQFSFKNVVTKHYNLLVSVLENV